jgi:hypothetical protein
MERNRETYREFSGRASIGGKRDMDAWCDWFRAHDIEPGHVSMDGWIERNVPHCYVRYLALVLDDDGNPQTRRKPDGTRPGPFEVHESWTEERTRQLFAPPAPFPVP